MVSNIINSVSVHTNLHLEFSLPMNIAPNLDENIHLERKRTIEIAKFRELKKNSCVHISNTLINVIGWMMLLIAFNRTTTAASFHFLGVRISCISGDFFLSSPMTFQNFFHFVHLSTQCWISLKLSIFEKHFLSYFLMWFSNK